MFAPVTALYSEEGTGRFSGTCVSSLYPRECRGHESISGLVPVLHLTFYKDILLYPPIAQTQANHPLTHVG